MVIESNEDGERRAADPSAAEVIRDAWPWFKAGRPEGEAWAAIEGMVGPEVCWAVWFYVNLGLQGTDLPHPQSVNTLRKDLKDMERLARDLRAKLANPAVGAFARAQILRDIGVRMVRDPDTGRVSVASGLEAQDPRRLFDALPAILALFEGLEAAILQTAPVRPGAPKNLRARALVYGVCVAFQDAGLPISSGENALLVRVARKTYKAFDLTGDPRDILRAMQAEIGQADQADTAESSGNEAETAKSPETPPGRARQWWGGELPE